MNNLINQLKEKIRFEAKESVKKDINKGIDSYQNKIIEITEKYGSIDMNKYNFYLAFLIELNQSFYAKENKDSFILISVFSFIMALSFLPYFMLKSLGLPLFGNDFNLGFLGLILYFIALSFFKVRTTQADNIFHLEENIKKYKEEEKQLYVKIDEILDKDVIPSDFSLYITQNHYYNTLKNTVASKELLLLLGKVIPREEFSQIISGNKNEDINLDLIIIGLKRAERKKINESIIENVYNSI